MRRLPPPPPARPVWTIKAQVLESKPSDVRVMEGGVARRTFFGLCGLRSRRLSAGRPTVRRECNVVAIRQIMLHVVALPIHRRTEAGIWRAAGCRAGRPVQRHRDQANDVASGCMAMHPRGEGWGIPRAVVERKRRVRTAGLPRRRSNRSCAPCPTIACACRLGRTA